MTTSRSDYQDSLKPRKLYFTEGSFNFLRTVVEVGFPALIALYFTLAELWSWTNTAEIMGTLAAVNLFLGALLKIGRYRYNTSEEKYDGEMVVNQRDPMKDLFTLALTKSPGDIPASKELRLKVVNE